MEGEVCVWISPWPSAPINAGGGNPHRAAERAVHGQIVLGFINEPRSLSEHIGGTLDVIVLPDNTTAFLHDLGVAKNPRILTSK
jgi:hypothetical protein